MKDKIEGGTGPVTQGLVMVVSAAEMTTARPKSSRVTLLHVMNRFSPNSIKRNSTKAKAFYTFTPHYYKELKRITLCSDFDEHIAASIAVTSASITRQSVHGPANNAHPIRPSPQTITYVTNSFIIHIYYEKTYANIRTIDLNVVLDVLT